MVTRSPIFRSSRASSVASAAAPKTVPRSIFGARPAIGHRHFGIEAQRAQHRIGVIDRLELDQCEPAVAGAQHAAQGRATDTAPRERRNAISSGLASRCIKENETSAAQQRAALARQSLVRLAATEPTPAIAITPSAMQAMKT